MSRYDETDVDTFNYEASVCLEEAAERLEGTLKAMKFVNRSQGKTYDLTPVKKSIESINKIIGDL